LTHLLVQFSYLQVLDFLTTVAFLLHGIREANPLVRWVLETSSHPLGGLLAVKLVAIALGICVWRLGRKRLLARMNVLFALLITWNLIALVLGAANLA
jgi:hypothetical protein